MNNKILFTTGGYIQNIIPCRERKKEENQNNKNECHEYKPCITGPGLFFVLFYYCWR
jgi:hypothetical protein